MLVKEFIDFGQLPPPQIEHRFNLLKELALTKLAEGTYDRFLWSLVGQIALRLEYENHQDTKLQ